jgi:hypothetical protein
MITFLDYLFTFPNSTGGLDGILTGTADTLVPLLLVFVFFTVWLGGRWRDSARMGTADYSFWGIIACVCTLLISLALTVKEGLISGTTLGVVVAITILMSVWYFLDRGDVFI